MDKKERVESIIKVFKKIYKDATCTLDYKDPLQLLVATQLAAQCTDVRVNMVTNTLFKKYKTALDFANADLEELERDIMPTGLYRNKARNIKEASRIIVDQFNGQVPGNLEDLLTLPGVGRKTANLVLGDVFGIPGIVVDTHAKRLSNRIGLSSSNDPKKVEFDLMAVVPKENWSEFCHQLVYHGRAVCHARKPECNKCSIIDYCDYGRQFLK
ncbi:MAG TPA: endonuclease III [Acetivibrio sp.]|nr:endonuclease III [Acetivibrio sp.]